MKAIQLLVNSILPEDLRDYERPMDSKSIGSLMADVARKYPDRYEEIAKKISDFGRKASFLQGETLTLSDTEPVFDRESMFSAMDDELDALRAQKLPPAEYKKAREGIWNTYAKLIKDVTLKEALANNSNLAYSVVSGARGSPDQLKMMVSSPALYTDAKDNLVPIFIRHSFGDGLRPAEYLAGTYGARKAVLSTKKATAKGGDLSKQMVQAATNLLISAEDCGANNGIDLDVDDKSLKGRVLAREQGGLKPGTILDKHSLAQLRKSGIEKVVARSAITCQAPTGVCSKCVGLRPDGHFEELGASVGITASQSIGEPITQLALNQKHGGGVSAGAKKVYSGFEAINQFVQTPDIFPDRAIVSEADGIVTGVEEASQGGFYVSVDGDKHYVPPGYPVTVKQGDKVEAGEQLSEGLIDPGDIVRLRGLGEGRRYYADRLKQILDDTGMSPDRRNVEMLARAALSNVRLKDADDDDESLPDDLVNYNYMASRYIPPIDAKKLPANKATGKYLQAPVLHYTIGTRITPSIARRLESTGINDIYASDVAPSFEADMTRLRTTTHGNQDWLAAMHTSYLKTQLVDKATRGVDTNIEENTHFAPRIAVGENFAKNIKDTGKF